MNEIVTNKGRCNPLNVGSLIETLASSGSADIDPEELRESLRKGIEPSRFVTLVKSSFLILDEEKWLNIEGVLCEALSMMIVDDCSGINIEHLKSIKKHCRGPLAVIAENNKV